jgi:hypothetical protein
MFEFSSLKRCQTFCLALHLISEGAMPDHTIVASALRFLNRYGRTDVRWGR